MKRRRALAARQLPQLVALGKLFRANRGRDPTGLDELERWLATPQGQTALTPLLGPDGKIVTDGRRFNGDARRFAGRKSA
jgi:hypothetical protein